MSDYVGVIDESQRAWASAFLASAAGEKIFGAAVNQGGISTWRLDRRGAGYHRPERLG